MLKICIGKGNEKWRCTKCNQVILKDELFAKECAKLFGLRVTHLKCFAPYNGFPVDFGKYIEDSPKLSIANIASVKKWVDSWNLQFRVVIPEKCLRKAVKTENPPSRRILLEVFVYLTPTEIEQLVAFACKDWFHVTRDEELWGRQYLAQFPAPAENCCYRELAITRRWECCWHCRKQLKLGNVANVCPVRGRWLCQKCFREEDECHIGKLSTLCKRWCISRSLVKVLQVPTFRYKGEKSVYVNEIRNRVLPHAFSRYQKLINALKTDYDKEIRKKVKKVIKNNNLEKLYEDDANVNEKLKYLYEFYGLMTDGKYFHRSVRKIVQKITAS